MSSTNLADGMRAGTISPQVSELHAHIVAAFREAGLTEMQARTSATPKKLLEVPSNIGTAPSVVEIFGQVPTPAMKDALAGILDKFGAQIEAGLLRYYWDGSSNSVWVSI